MHLIRRSALRAASSPATSFIASSKSISASNPFAIKTLTQSSISAFRRAYSDDASDRPAPADGGYAPREYQQRESRPRYENNRDGGRGGYGGGRSGGYGGDRGGDRPSYGGVRSGGYGGNRGGDRGGYGGERRGPPRDFAPREVVPGPSIYVGNLLFDVTAKDLVREFEAFGTIKDTTIATDARGLSKGFGYIEFESQENAAAAIEAKHQSVLEGRRLVVNYMSKSTRERPENPPSKTLFIGNLAFEMSDADLNKLFRDIKNVIDVRVAIDRRTGQPRGFAHADFVDVESATNGRAALLDKEVYGRKLRVDFSAGSREARTDGAERIERDSSDGSPTAI